MRLKIVKKGRRTEPNLTREERDKRILSSSPITKNIEKRKIYIYELRYLKEVHDERDVECFKIFNIKVNQFL